MDKDFLITITWIHNGCLHFISSMGALIRSGSNKFNLNLYLDVQNIYAFDTTLPDYLDVRRDADGNPLVDPANPGWSNLFTGKYNRTLPSIGVIFELWWLMWGVFLKKTNNHGRRTMIFNGKVHSNHNNRSDISEAAVKWTLHIFLCDSSTDISLEIVEKVV